MHEHDELDRLRAADPVDPASLPLPEDPTARALFERIVMTDTELRPPAAPERRPTLRWAAAAAAVAVAVAGGAFALTAGGDDDGARVATPTTVTTQVPINPGGTVQSCITTYDRTTLAEREYAFDGTVDAVDVDADSVTFTVNRWFHGGEGSSITLQGAGTIAGVTSADASLPLEPGTHLLVAGDGGFAWSCGFTQPYDDAVASDWATVFGA
jgi:hypothetical protein